MRKAVDVKSGKPDKPASRTPPALPQLQKALDEARQESELLRLVLDEVDESVVVTDSDRALICANSGGRRMLRTNERLLALITEQLPDSDWTDPRQLELPDPVSGRRSIVQISSKALLNADGSARAIVSRLSDAAHPAPAERRALEQRLSESEKLAALGRLAATVAHEINNPLEAILNALYLVESRTTSDDTNRIFLEIANRELKRVSAIVRQMLGVYRTRVSVVPVDVNALLCETATLLEHQLRTLHVTVALDLAVDLPPAMGRPDQVKQVFISLLLNAAEAMPDGGTIGLQTRRPGSDDQELTESTFVLARVSDSGTGIPDEHLPNIFEPFCSTKHGNSGSGLGLWVSLGIVENLGGQITVQSRLGRGTTFTVALPSGNAR